MPHFKDASDRNTADTILAALDKFFLTPSLANMVAVFQALQAHRAAMLAGAHSSSRRALVAQALHSNTDRHLAA